MEGPAVSVIVPTRNRPEKLVRIVAGLSRQDVGAPAVELIVCDDGSEPPLVLPRDAPGRLIRLEGRGRSAARNIGGEMARGEILVFLDDDMLVQPGFLGQHVTAHASHANSLVTGRIRLPPASLLTALGRFRQALEDSGMPGAPGPSGMPNLCAAGNASLSRETFHRLGGFDATMESGEDQDLALRHAAQGGQNVYWPAAEAVHDDDALDIETYCRRAEWGMRQLGPFLRKYPDWPDNVERERVNGPIHLGGEPIAVTARKLAKYALSAPPLVSALLALTRSAERAGAGQRLLRGLYTLLLGVHIQRGYRGRR